MCMVPRRSASAVNLAPPSSAVEHAVLALLHRGSPLARVHAHNRGDDHVAQLARDRRAEELDQVSDRIEAPVLECLVSAVDVVDGERRLRVWSSRPRRRRRRGRAARHPAGTPHSRHRRSGRRARAAPPSNGCSFRAPSTPTRTFALKSATSVGEAELRMRSPPNPVAVDHSRSPGFATPGAVWRIAMSVPSGNGVPAAGPERYTCPSVEVAPALYRRGRDADLELVRDRRRRERVDEGSEVVPAGSPAPPPSRSSRR